MAQILVYMNAQGQFVRADNGQPVGEQTLYSTGGDDNGAGASYYIEDNTPAEVAAQNFQSENGRAPVGAEVVAQNIANGTGVPLAEFMAGIQKTNLLSKYTPQQIMQLGGYTVGADGLVRQTGQLDPSIRANGWGTAGDTAGFGQFLGAAVPAFLGAGLAFGGGLGGLTGGEFVGPPQGFMGPLAPGAGLETQMALNGLGTSAGNFLNPDFVGPPDSAAPNFYGPPESAAPNFYGPPTSAMPSANTSLPSMPTTPNLPGTNSPTLPTVPGTSETVIPGVPTGTPSASGNLMDWLQGTGTNGLPNWLSAGGSALSGLLGYSGGQDALNLLKTNADREWNARQPALNTFNNALTNPDTWYQSAPAMGGVDAVLRKLGVNGNPALNPGDLSKAAAYNLGGYNDYLKTLQGPAFSTAGVTSQNTGQVAAATGAQYNPLRSALGDILNPTPDISKQVGQLGGLLKLSGYGLS